MHLNNAGLHLLFNYKTSKRAIPNLLVCPQFNASPQHGCVETCEQARLLLISAFYIIQNRCQFCQPLATVLFQSMTTPFCYCNTRAGPATINLRPLKQSAVVAHML